jgi:predicted aconitase with swiveling domain
LLEGRAAGAILTLDEPLSLWGGLDPESGTVVDPRHPQVGAVVAGRMLLMPRGRGSSSASSILAECIRAGVGPAGIVLGKPDAIVTLGALAAAELYPDRVCPIVVVDDQSSYEALAEAGRRQPPAQALLDRQRLSLVGS